MTEFTHGMYTNYYTAFDVVSTDAATGFEQYSLTTNAGSASFAVNTHIAQQTVIQVANAEEDYADIVESDRAMAEARVRGTKSWRQLKKELDL